MRYGIISDIHANLPALTRVLEYFDSAQIDAYLCCGDIVGYGAHPNECCDRIRELNTVSVMGNHDEAAWRPQKDQWFSPAARVCIQWTRERLTDDHTQYLQELPRDTSVDGIHLCHGSLPDPDEYVYESLSAQPTLDQMAEQVCFFGHTHCAGWFVQRQPETVPVKHNGEAGGQISIEDGSKYMINPGAVGQPRDGNSQAGCAVYDTDDGTVTIKRLGYDIEAAQRAIIRAGLPEQMASRLATGM